MKDAKNERFEMVFEMRKGIKKGIEPSGSHFSKLKLIKISKT